VCLRLEEFSDADTQVHHALASLVLPHLYADIDAEFEKKKNELEQAAMTCLPAWPRSSDLFLPFSPTMQEDSVEFQSLCQVAAHRVAAEKLAELVEFAMALQTPKDEDIYMQQAKFKLDELRLHAAKVLMAAIRSKGTPCIALDTSGAPHMERLTIPEDTVCSMHKFMESSAVFRYFISIDVESYDQSVKDCIVELGKMADSAEAWLRVLAAEIRSFWLAGLTRLKGNLEATYPRDWRSFCVDARDAQKILTDVCNTRALDKLLPAQSALKDGFAAFENATTKINASGVGPQLDGQIAALILDSKQMLGVRAASTVTLVKIPAAPTAKSRSGFARECRRLIKALNITLPMCILSEMDKAVSEGEA
jgi:hypothetical protein